MEIVGDYEYSKKDLIGHGAFAVVFKGRLRKRPDRPVAIKSITKKNLAKSQNLLSKEIKILRELSDLHHDNVVALMDCKETANHVYLVMEYCNGGDLADYLQVKGTLSEDTLSIFLRQIAGAMKALNAKGVVHRDLKPQNILLCHSGKASAPPQEIQLKIADFGFARFLNDGVMAATLCGSPMYMAPEVIMSLQYDAKADLWSIGTIVFQCLTGKAPFQAQTPQQLKQFYERNAELIPNIPSGTSPELKDLLLNLLKKNAKTRIDFDHFFCHKFLQPVVSPAASSSPVPVPNRSLSFGSDTSSPSLKQTPASPLTDATNRFTNKVAADSALPTDVSAARGLDVASRKVPVDDHTRSDTEASLDVSTEHDFVMVPEGLPSDQSMTSDKGSRTQGDDFGSGDREPMSLKTVNINPGGETVTFRNPVRGHDSPAQETSPNRPSTLPVQSPKHSPPSSEPIPVPTQVKAYQRFSCTESPNSPRRTPPPNQSTKQKEDGKQELVRTSSETKLTQGPDIGSISPPNVQFTIGTPPSSQWRRGSVGTPPQGRHSVTPPTGSPLRKSGNTPPRSSPLPFVGPGSLPTILGSPTRLGFGMDIPYADNVPSEPVHAPFGSYRTQTIPDNMATIPYSQLESTSGNANTGVVYGTSPPPSRSRALVLGRSETEPGQFISHIPGASRLTEQLMRTAYGGPPSAQTGTIACYSASPQSRERSSSFAFERSPLGLDQERSSAFFRRGSTYVESSPPGSFLYAQSPPNMEGPITFVAPELQEETLMDAYHNEILAKLSFVLDLVECIMELAQIRGTPIHNFSDTVGQRQTDTHDTIPRFSEAQRRLEQLVLYMRSLHLLASSLQLAKDEIKSNRLQPSNSLKSVARDMNTHYHRCLAMCRQLHRHGFTQHSSLSPQLIAITADKLIYNYAIELCQTAALDELFGNPQECFKRYRTAQILLHSLAQQAKNSRDKELLNKYREAVEKRLFNMQGQQGNMNPYDAYS